MSPMDLPRAPGLASGPDADGLCAEALLRIADRCARYEDELKAGRRPTPEAYLADVADPAEAAELRQQLAGLVDDYAEGRGARPDGALGDFELLKRIGCGGMGVVYRARRRAGPSRDGVVALKIIHPPLLGRGAKALRRFRLEFEIARELDVPCVVPVYELSGDGDCHYYSMRYIDGPDLGAWIDEHLAQNQWPAHDQVVELLRDVAQAVHRAHERGVVHRDLKPSNILIERRTGRPWIADFGLALRLGDTGRLTGAGDAPGTPAYMAPEQASGAARAIGPAADVYGLGAVLYTALTGLAPFSGLTRDEILLKVLHTRPPRPRTLNPAIPRDLEAICLKCLEPDPRDRYDSARALADDLALWHRGVPPRAVRGGLWGRGVRYVRRHPDAVLRRGLAAFAVLACVALLALAHTKAQIEANAKARIEANYQQSRNVTRRIISFVDNELRELPGNAPVRHDLLKTVREYYQIDYRVVQAPLELAQIYEHSAVIDFELGDLDQALGHNHKALRIYQGLPATADRQIAEGRILNRIGLIHRRVGRLVEARRYYDQARVVLDRLPAPDRDRAEAHVVRAETCFLLGDLAHYGEGRFDGARPSSLREEAPLSLYQRAEAILRRLRSESPAAAQEPIEGDLARVLGYLGDLRTELGWATPPGRQAEDQFKKAEACYRESLELRRGLHDRRPMSPERQFQLARGYLNFVTLNERRADAAALAGADADSLLDAAIGHCQQAREHQRQLVAANGSVNEYRGDLAWTLYLQGRLKMKRHLCAEALWDLARAEDLYRELRQQRGDTTVSTQRGLAQTLRRLASLQLSAFERRAGGAADNARRVAHDHLDQALTLLKGLGTRPDDSFEVACAETLLGRDDQALGALKKALQDGFRDRYGLLLDPDLAPLRSRDTFRTLRPQNDIVPRSN